MIPKIVHFCWFGRNQYDSLVKRCIDSWNRLIPDFEFILWNESNFDVSFINFTKQAYDHKFYAFVSDFVRLYALFEYGGVYLDTDVELLKRLDKFMELKGFIGFEKKLSPKTKTEFYEVGTGTIGSIKGHELIKELMQYYYNLNFIENSKPVTIPNPEIFGKVMKKYGLVENNKFQIIKDMAVFPNYYFSPKMPKHKNVLTNRSFSIHHFSGSWLKHV